MTPRTKRLIARSYLAIFTICTVVALGLVIGFENLIPVGVLMVGAVLAAALSWAIENA